MMENYENVNHLVLNFYRDGYSIAVKLNEFPVFTSETILETARISYEETSLLDYIENEELPPLLVEMIDSSPKLSQYKIWHNGCLILEVRDKIELTSPDDNNTETHSYRSQSAAKYVSQSALSNCYENGVKDDCDTLDQKTSDRKHFILLKPTNLSMLYDVLNLTDSKCWTAQERLQLESQIVLHNSPSLSLEPDEPTMMKTTSTSTEDQSDEILLTSRDAIPCSNGDMNSPIKQMDSNGNSEYSKLKISKQSASQKLRLKDIYTNRTIYVSHTKSNGGNNSNNNKNHNNNGGNNRTNGRQSKMYNLYNNHNNNQSSNNNTNNHHRQLTNNSHHHYHQHHHHHHNHHQDQASTAPERFPPELMLHQFLAARRTTKQKSLPFGPTPRFHRYKQSRSYK